MEMARLITFGGIIEVTAPPLLKIFVNGWGMNIKSNKIAWRSRNKIAPRRKRTEVKRDDELSEAKRKER